MTQFPSCQMSSNRSCHIIIIGGGLAGLATALGLRNGGHEVTVLERVPEFSKVSLKSLKFV